MLGTGEQPRSLIAAGERFYPYSQKIHLRHVPGNAPKCSTNKIIVVATPLQNSSSQKLWQYISGFHSPAQPLSSWFAICNTAVGELISHIWQSQLCSSFCYFASPITMSKVQWITLRFLMFVLCSVAASLSRQGNSSKVILLVNHNLFALYVCMYVHGAPLHGMYMCIYMHFQNFSYWNSPALYWNENVVPKVVCVCTYYHNIITNLIYNTNIYFCLRMPLLSFMCGLFLSAVHIWCQ